MNNHRHAVKIVKPRMKDKDAYFMRLPEPIRRAIQNAPINCSLNGLQAYLKANGEAATLEWIQRGIDGVARRNLVTFYDEAHPQLDQSAFKPLARNPNWRPCR